MDAIFNNSNGAQENLLYKLSGFLVGTGLYIALSTHSVIQNTRVILLLICRYLFIPLSIISIAFIITLIAKQLHHHQPISNSTSFLSIAFLSILFINGLYEGGNAKIPYPPFLFWIIRIFLCLTPFFALIGLYTIYFGDSVNCICKAGLNIDNFYYLINATLLTIYTICYAVITLQREKPWLKSIEKTNIGLAIFLIAITLITANSWVIKRIPMRHHPKTIPAQPAPTRN